MNTHTPGPIISTSKPRFLMCPPDYYSPQPPGKTANKFEIEGWRLYDENKPKFMKIAHEQYDALQVAFMQAGIEITEIKPVKGENDLVFMADQSLTLLRIGAAFKSNLEAVTIMSRFTNANRVGEIAHCEKYFRQSHPERTLHHSQHPFEGKGDNLYDAFRDLYWSGYGINPTPETAAAARSDRRAHADLARLTGVHVVSLAVKEPFFHIDTALGQPLTYGHLVCYPGGFQPGQFEILKQKAFADFGLKAEDYLIEVDEKDALHYACNLVCSGDTVFMTACSQDLRDRVKAKGYNVVTVDMSHFISAGGAIHCLVNDISEVRVPGGLIRKHGGHHTLAA